MMILDPDPPDVDSAAWQDFHCPKAEQYGDVAGL